MEIHIRVVRDVTIVDLEGDLVRGAPVSAFRVQMKALIAAGNNKVIVNLSGVSLIDIDGIADLFSATQSCYSAGVRCCFFGAQPRVKQAVIMARISTILDYYEIETEALASFGVSS